MAPFSIWMWICGVPLMWISLDGTKMGEWAKALMATAWPVSAPALILIGAVAEFVNRKSSK